MTGAIMVCTTWGKCGNDVFHASEMLGKPHVLEKHEIYSNYIEVFVMRLVIFLVLIWGFGAYLLTSCEMFEVVGSAQSQWDIVIASTVTMGLRNNNKIIYIFFNDLKRSDHGLACNGLVMSCYR